MAKLYAFEDVQDIKISEVQDPKEIKDIEPDLELMADSLEVSTEALKTSVGYLNIVTDIKTNLNNKDRSKPVYFSSLENYEPILKNVAENLGVRSRIPSMEDFKNPYGTEASHQIAIEGFFDYIRRIWEKIKQVFTLFFAKIRLFFKRLYNWDLELEDYEKYVEDMIQKIKSKKATISDNKAIINSKLPMLLANPGMQNVTSDFILNEGTRKIETLIRVIDNLYGDKLKALVNDNLNKVESGIGTILTEANRPGSDVNSVKSAKDSVINIALNSMNLLFDIDFNGDLNKLPKKAYDAVQYNFSGEEISDGGMTVRALVDNTNGYNTLPKDFNCYYICYNAKKIYINSSTENNTHVSENLPPISNVDNLVSFYSEYKKFKAKTDTKKMASSNEVIDKKIDKLIGKMKSDFSKTLETLNKGKPVNNLKDRVYRVTLEISRRYKSNKDKIDNQLSIPFNREVGSSIQLADLDNIIQLLTAMDGTFSLEFSAYLINLAKAEDRVKIVSAFERILSISNSSDSNGNQLEAKPVIKELEEFQKFLINYFNSIQVFLKTLAIDLSGTQAQIRYEWIKYIYKSGYLYKVN